MTGFEIIQRMMEVWAGDADLTAFCTGTYGKRQTIRNFVDMNNPVPDEDFPLISFYGSRSSGGITPSMNHHEFLVGFAIMDNAVSVDEDLRIEKSVGLENVQRFRHLAQQALFNAQVGRIDWEGEEDPLTDFPVFTGYATIVVETPNIRTR